jgi:hypothetical protein
MEVGIDISVFGGKILCSLLFRKLRFGDTCYKGITGMRRTYCYTVVVEE